jgi:thioredoxin 1
MVQEISKLEVKSFEEIIKDGFVVVKFFATWCGPCKMMVPILKEVSETMPDLKIYKYDVDVFRELAVSNNVRSIPTIIIYKDGKELDRKSGYSPKDAIVSWFDSVIKSGGPN